MELRNDLVEQYEDAVFALAMDAIAAEEGAELLRENERLKAVPGFRIPEPLDQRCRKAIVRGFRRLRRKRTLRAAGHALQRVSLAVLVVLLLFTGVYAALPESRTASAKRSDSWFAVVSSEIRRIISSKEVDGQLPYEFDVLPEGFALAAAGSDGETYWKYYKNNNDERIQLTVIDTSYGRSASTLTSGSVQRLEAIQVNGNEGVLEETYGGTLKAEIFDETHNILLDIRFYGPGRDDALYVLTGLTYTGVDFYGTPYNFTFD